MSRELLNATFRLMLQNTAVTLELFFAALALSMLLGLLLAVGRRSKNILVSGIIRLYLLVMRGTPLILQLMFFYYGPYYIFGKTLPRITAAIVGLALNSAAYSCEIYRAGIDSVSVGQHEAAYVLGFSRWQTFTKITLPQVIKHILPPFSNECMALVKNTSLAQIIGVVELFRVANIQMAKYFTTIPLLIAAAFYLIMCGVLERLFHYMEKRYSYYR
ncbi:MAG: amino acid ABC transporter permease [Clostridium sp.]|nr:amino acid ABC transporter permease [Clostridium sp.]